MWLNVQQFCAHKIMKYSRKLTAIAEYNNTRYISSSSAMQWQILMGGGPGSTPPPLFCQKILLKKGKNKSFWKPKFLDLPLQLTCTQPFCNAQVSAAQKYCSVALVYVHIHCFVIAITDDIKDFN